MSLNWMYGLGEGMDRVRTFRLALRPVKHPLRRLFHELPLTTTYLGPLWRVAVKRYAVGRRLNANQLAKRLRDEWRFWTRDPVELVECLERDLGMLDLVSRSEVVEQGSRNIDLDAPLQPIDGVRVIFSHCPSHAPKAFVLVPQCGHTAVEMVVPFWMGSWIVGLWAEPERAGTDLMCRIIDGVGLEFVNFRDGALTLSTLVKLGAFRQ